MDFSVSLLNCCRLTLRIFPVLYANAYWHTCCTVVHQLQHLSQKAAQILFAQIPHWDLTNSLTIHVTYQTWSSRTLISCCNIPVKQINVCVCVWMHESTFGWFSMCLSVLSRCAGMAECCNASCFANRLGSAEGCNVRLNGVGAHNKINRRGNKLQNKWPSH